MVNFAHGIQRVFTILIKHVAVCVLVVAMSESIAEGQTITNPTDVRTPLALAPGSPNGSRVEDFANVNLFNGNLNFVMPLGELGGRGDVSVSPTLTIERHWQVMNRCDPTSGGGIVCYRIPNSMWWGNIQVGYGPGVMQGRGGAVYSAGGCHTGSPYTMTFTDPGGTEHELRDRHTNGTPALWPQCGQARGTVFTSVNGTSMSFVSDVSINDDSTGGSYQSRPSGYLMLGNGTRYRFSNGIVLWIRDRHGNQTNFTYDNYDYGANSRVTAITDSIGRQVTINYDVTEEPFGLCDKITHLGIGGAPRVIRITKAPLSSALRSDSTIQTYGQLFADSSFANSSTQFNPTIISGVHLPHGKSYKLLYNSYGELGRIEIPTGGAVEYDFTGGLTNQPPGGAYGSFVYRRVIAKRVFADASNPNSLASKATYSRPESINSQSLVSSTGYVEVDQKDVNGLLMSREKHYFYGTAAGSFFQTTHPSSPWKHGREYKAESIDQDGFTVLRTIEHTWQQRASVSWWYNYATTHHLNPADEPAYDPRLVETRITLEPDGANLVSKQTFDYSKDENNVPDIHNNLTDAWEYGFGIGGPSTHPVRRTHTEYLTTNPANNINYANPANGVSYTASDVHLRNLPTANQVYAINPSNGAETPVAKTETRYDEPSYPLLTYATVVNWTDPGAAHGNATTVRNWLDTNNTWMEIHVRYDQCGNGRYFWDANGNESRLDYTDSYSDGVVRNTFAFPTTTTSAIPDSSGLNGSNAALSKSTVYDFATGLVVSLTDINAKTTTVAYSDLLNRITSVVRPAGGGSTTYEYGDSPNNHFIRTQTTLNASQSKENYQYFDGLGRSKRSLGYDGTATTPWIAVDIHYEQMGRVRAVSNPYRVTTQSGVVTACGTCTTTEFDVLGRVKTITTPDNAQVITAYGASTTGTLGTTLTVTDQAGKKRKSLLDALGRLVRVFEDPDNLNQVTSYGYDVLGNLRTVTQDAQTRTFVYDSLSRLTSATNPENGMVAYQHDNNGNLEQKTDARDIVTTYDYDRLNRLVSRNYLDDPGQTPPVSYFYDGKGLTSPASNALGRLTKVSSSVSDVLYTGYDAMGSVTGSTQVTGGQTYQMGYAYDLSGNLTSQTYPSGRVITSSYDTAGRLNSVSGQEGGGATKPYASLLSYSPHGAIKEMKLGNNLWAHTIFNERLQPQLIGLGTSQDIPNPQDLNRFRVDYSYGGATNNGNLINQTISVPDAAGNVIAQMTQSYSYDDLNRIEVAQENAGASWKQSFIYDQYGNRTFDTGNTTANALGSVLTIDPANNRLTAGQGYLLYDLAGNVTRDFNGHTFAYDADNRQTSYDGGSEANGTDYKYDGDGRRVQKVTGTGQVTTTFVYNASGLLVAEYGASTSSGTSYFTSDNLGTPRIITDATGAVRARHDYLPFGEEIGLTGGRSAPQGYQTDTIRQKFTQYERDFETGLDFAQERYYASAQGRFTSVDPTIASGTLVTPQSWNRYIYCVNNPLAYIDPDGMRWYRPTGEFGDWRPVWFDEDPGNPGKHDGYELLPHDYVYYSREVDGYVSLDGFNGTFEVLHSEQDAKDFAQERHSANVDIYDQPFNVSLLDSTLELSGFIPSPGGLLRGAVRRTALSQIEKLAARRVIFEASKKAGRLAEKEVLEQLLAEGNKVVASQVWVKTSAGFRVIDHLIEDAAGKLVAIEVKSGGAVRSAKQLLKDKLMSTEGARIVSRKVPDQLRGTTQVIQTIERRP